MRNEAEENDLVALAHHALENERLMDLVVDLAEDGGHLGKWNNDLGWDDRRPDSLEAHRGESLLPLVLGSRGLKFSTAGTGDDGGERRIDLASTRLGVRDDRKVGLRKLGLVVVVRHLPRVPVTVRQLLLEARGLGVEKCDRPDRK